MIDPIPAATARRNADLTDRLLFLGMNRRIPLAVLLAAFGGTHLMNESCARAEAPASTGAAQAHRELGAVRWLRDFDAALAESRRTGKPVLVLFDEVPGCHTCVSFGETVLRHPLIVEAAEELFVPIAIFNNAEGADRAVLKSFNEPEWNNPVVRIIGADRQELAPRVDGDYSTRGIVLAMTESLKKSGRAVPGYLSLLAEEAAPRAKQSAVYSMHCFWEGEAHLGGVEGVLSTRTGFAGGKEVVEVIFDADLLNRSTLDARAKQMSCLREDAPGAVRPSTKDEKYQLRGTPYEAVPMTALQATRLNAAVGAGSDAKAILSPRQIALADHMKGIDPLKRPNFIGRTDLAGAWAEAARSR